MARLNSPVSNFSRPQHHAAGKQARAPHHLAPAAPLCYAAAMTPTKDQALATAATLFETRYAGADFAIACGSILRGEGRPGSDLDLVVVHPALPNARRESLLCGDLPVEIFVHDPGTLQHFIDADIADGCGTMPHMIATGQAVPAGNAGALALQAHAAALIAAGPPPLSAEADAFQRYLILDLIDDLRGAAPPFEQRAIMMRLHQAFASYALRRDGRFAGRGKHLSRALARHRPALLAVLDASLAAACGPGIDLPEIAALDAALAECGGGVFDGFRQEAPADRRAAPRWLEE